MDSWSRTHSLHINSSSPFRSNSETKLYIIIDSKTPLVLKAPVPPGFLTLGQFKAISSLQDDCYKFYFKSHDSEFGTVKEEVVDDDSVLPVEGEKVVAWVISNKSTQSALFETPVESNQVPQTSERCLPRGSPSMVYIHNSRDHVYDLMQSPTHESSQNGQNRTHSPTMYRPTFALIPHQGGFNPVTDLPEPLLIDDDNLSTSLHEQGSFGRGVEITRPTARSLPRSLTPRSLCATSNIENRTSNNDLRLQIDSRSVHEPTTPTSIRQIDIALHCGKDSIHTIYEALRADSASLDIKDREWLKVVVKGAFLGSTLVKWLRRNVYGFRNGSEVRRYADQMLHRALIRSPMSQHATFSEKCYYTLT